MKLPITILLTLLAISSTVCVAQQQEQKLRVMVLTDIENEPDDAQSLIRFLTYSNNWNVEGLIATTSTHKKDKPAGWRIKEIVNADDKVRYNLLLHEKGYPILKKGY